MIERGAKEDGGKLQWRLFPFDALKEVGRVLMWGAYERPRADGTKGYGANNWEHVPNARDRYFDALLRHAVGWYCGEERDAESGIHTLAHAGCCLLFLLALDLRARRATDSIPYAECRQSETNGGA